MRRLTIITVVGASVLLGGCGDDTREPDNARGGKPAPRGATSPPKAGTPQDPAAAGSTGSAGSARRRLIYLDARTLCGEFGVRQVIRRFGLEPGSAPEVARAYADQNYSVPFREAGYRGCLAGFRK